MESSTAGPGDESRGPQLRRLIAVCRQFEAAWKAHRAAGGAGAPPRVEAALAGAPREPGYSEWLRELIARDVDFRREGGEDPAPGDYLGRFPGHAGVILPLFEADGHRPGGRSAPYGYDDPDRTCSFVAADARGTIRSGRSPGEEGWSHEAFRFGCVLLDRYELIRNPDREDGLLGKGGMGVVFLGRDRVLGRNVAIKAVLFADDEEKRRREKAFGKEVRCAAKLGQAAIATVYDFGHHEGHPFAVFEYLQGWTLDEFIGARARSGIKITLEEFRLILGPLAQALDAAHGCGVIHRDLKPANVRSTVAPAPGELTFRGQFKVLDLGLAADYRSHTTEWGGFQGTPAYAAPEQFTESACDGRTDQFALALIAFEALTGHRFFEGLSWRQIEAAQCGPEPLQVPPSPDLSDAVRSALAKALSKDPNQRYASCEEFAGALGCRFLSDSPHQSPYVLASPAHRLRGRWGSPRLDLRPAPGVLMLTDDALWCCNDGELGCWSLRDIKLARPRGRRWLELGISTPDRDAFHQLVKVPDARDWAAKIDLRRRAAAAVGGPDPAATTPQPVLAPPLFPRRPPVRVQTLGRVEAEARTLALARATLQIRARQLGGDAVADTTEEPETKFNRNLWRASGVAIKAVDADGWSRLRAKEYVGEVRRVTRLMLAFLLASALFLGLINAKFHHGYPPRSSFLLDPLTAGGVRVASSLPFPEILALSLAAMAAAYSWPLGLILLLRRLRWPQLVMPAAVAFFALTLGHLVWIAEANKRFFGDYLIGIAIAVLGWSLASRARRAYRVYMASVPIAERRVAGTRRAAVRAVRAGVVLLSVVPLLGSFTPSLALPPLPWVQSPWYDVARQIGRVRLPRFNGFAAYLIPANVRAGWVARRWLCGTLTSNADQAEAEFAAAATEHERLAVEYPTAAGDFSERAVMSFAQLGTTLFEAGRHTEAYGAFQKAFARDAARAAEAKALGARPRLRDDYRFALALARVSAGMALVQIGGDDDRAVRLIREGLADDRFLRVLTTTTAPAIRALLPCAKYHLALAMDGLGREAEATAEYRDTVRMIRALPSPLADDPAVREILDDSLLRLRELAPATRGVRPVSHTTPVVRPKPALAPTPNQEPDS